MTEQEIRDGVAARKWFHNVQLPYGIVTPGTREPDAWTTYHLPDKLDGLRVLDIGAWDGGFSFEAERRGAKSVVALDLWDKPDPGTAGLGKDNFDFCRAALGSKVQAVQGSCYNLGYDLSKYDLVLFLEVLYHLQNPLLALQMIHGRLATGGMVCLETWIDAEWIDEPVAVFYPGSELNNDPTNWWGPNILCVKAMAFTAGFRFCDLVWSRPDVHLGGRGKRACFHLR